MECGFPRPYVLLLCSQTQTCIQFFIFNSRIITWSVGVPPLAFYFTTGLHFGSKSPIGDLVWLDGLSVIWILFFFNSLSRTNISHNTKMNESEINAPRTFVMWTLWYSAPTCLTFWSAPICYSMHSLCWPRCQRSVSQEAIYFSCPDLPSPLSMLLLQNKLRISVKSFIDNVCFTIPLGFGFGIVCLKCTLHFTLTSLWQVRECQESPVFKWILVWDHQKFRKVNIIPMI